MEAMEGSCPQNIRWIINMNRYTSTEKWLAAWACLLVIAGLIMVAKPSEMVVITGGGIKYHLPPAHPEFVSKRGTQIYGVISILTGVGVFWLALYRGRPPER